jgi:hypothetical protein
MAGVLPLSIPVCVAPGRNHLPWDRWWWTRMFDAGFGVAEAPSSLRTSQVGNGLKLTWEVHGGEPTGIVVERRLNSGTEGGRSWHQFAKLSANADQYIDTGVNAQSVDYRVHAINANGSSAYSNVVRVSAKRLSQ